MQQGGQSLGSYQCPHSPSRVANFGQSDSLELRVTSGGVSLKACFPDQIFPSPGALAEGTAHPLGSLTHFDALACVVPEASWSRHRDATTPRHSQRRVQH